MDGERFFATFVRVWGDVGNVASLRNFGGEGMLCGAIGQKISLTVVDGVRECLIRRNCWDEWACGWLCACSGDADCGDGWGLP